jgi:nucleoside-diphosphate-sugar epimerase
LFAVVTGAAGFIGSQLSETLIDAGYRVLGIDCFTNYYPRPAKWANLSKLMARDRFELIQADLRKASLNDLIEGADVVFHQAAQPGVRQSWAAGFAQYCSHNVLATQRLLEAAKQVGTPRLVYASSSSLYGNALTYPTRETDLPRPFSPYGVTKLAAEHLCQLYAANWGVPTVSLRYFTVYGPRQRPDMAMRRLVDAALTGQQFPLYGSGRQIRDFTYVDDVVGANLAAATEDVAPGTVVNIAGGSNVSMLEVIDLVGELTESSVALDHRPAQPGDVERTGGSIDAARDCLRWEPQISLRSGLTAMVAWANTAGLPLAATG